MVCEVYETLDLETREIGHIAVIAANDMRNRGVRIRTEQMQRRH